MTRILAIEPDLERGALLRRMLRDAVRADVTVIPTTKAALTALSAHAPDLREVVLAHHPDRHFDRLRRLHRARLA